MKYSVHLYCHTISLNISPLPLIILQLMMMYLGSPVLCTALLTLTMLSSLRSFPAPPLLVCNKVSVGQLHHYTAW